MALFPKSNGGQPQKLTQILSETFLRPAKPRKDAPITEPWGDRILEPDQRRAAMDSLDPVETKVSRAGLIMVTIVVPILAIYNAANHGSRTVIIKGHKTLLPLQTNWLILGGVILAFCILGFIALYRRKRTLVVFTFFILGLSVIPLLSPLGFAAIALAGWLMIRGLPHQ